MHARARRTRHAGVGRLLARTVPARHTERPVPRRAPTRRAGAQVGPGVYVGAGWKAPREGRHELGRRFLRFLLVRQA
jgi:hypothetical protein